MRILYLPVYFSPEQAASPYLGKNRNQALCEAGYEIFAYVPTPTRGVSPAIRKEYKNKEHRIEYQHEGKMEIRRFSMFPEKKNLLLRVIRYLFVFIKQYSYSSRLIGVNCIFLPSTPPIQGVLGSLLKKKLHAPFIYNLQDIFPDSMTGSGLTKKGGFLWKIGRKIEDFTYRSADKIIVISEDFKKNIMAKGVPEEKIAVIYNWVDEDAVVDIPREDNKLFDKYGLDRNLFYICYSGNIGLTQNMDLLLEVMEELKTEAPDLRLVLIGEGAYKNHVVKKIAGRTSGSEIVKGTALPNVVMLPFQPYEDISQVFSLGDAGLVISKPGVGENSVPSKTWSIMSASRPVLANFDENELKSIITEHQCGIFTKAGDKIAFKRSILDLYLNRDLCKAFGLNGRKYVLQNLTRTVGTQKYVDIIKGFDGYNA